MRKQSKDKRLIAVVVTYNRLEQLKYTLSRLLESPADHLARIVVFDNASTDGTKEWLSGLNEDRLDVIHNKKNLGGAHGFEQGMRHAVLTCDPDWLVLMDDDARPASDALGRFHTDTRDQYDAWVASVRYPDGQTCEMNRPWVNPFWHMSAFLRSVVKGREGYHLGHRKSQTTQTYSVDGGSFVGLFVSRRAIDLVGFPNGCLFIYGDDVLYTLGLTRSGGRIAFDPALGFEHDCTTITEANFRVLSPLWKAYYFHRNQVMVYRQAAGPILFWPLLLLKVLQWRISAREYGDQKAAYKVILAKAVRAGIQHDTDISHDAVLKMVSGA